MLPNPFGNMMTDLMPDLNVFGDDDMGLIPSGSPSPSDSMADSIFGDLWNSSPSADAKQPETQAAVEKWMMPLQGTRTSGYGVDRGTHRHSGIDIGAAAGTPIKAARSGTVKFVGPKGAYGNTVILDHGDGTESLYAHASKLMAKAGQRVAQGTPIAAVGSTGRSTGPHLHFETRKGGKPVNPDTLIGKAAKTMQSIASNPNLPDTTKDNLMDNLMGGLMKNLMPKVGNPMLQGMLNQTLGPVFKDMFGGSSEGGIFGDLWGDLFSDSGSDAPQLGSGANFGSGDIQNMIRQTAQQMGVPPALALAVAKMESGFRQAAKSPAGAIGVMQLMPATAKGLGVNPHVLEQNIKGGIKYLKQLLNQFGNNYEKVLAGYNAGPSAARSGKWRSYGETRNYVNKGLGMLR